MANNEGKSVEQRIVDLYENDNIVRSIVSYRVQKYLGGNYIRNESGIVARIIRDSTKEILFDIMAAYKKLYNDKVQAESKVRMNLPLPSIIIINISGNGSPSMN